MIRQTMEVSSSAMDQLIDFCSTHQLNLEQHQCIEILCGRWQSPEIFDMNIPEDKIRGIMKGLPPAKLTTSRVYKYHHLEYHTWFKDGRKCREAVYQPEILHEFSSYDTLDVDSPTFAYLAHMVEYHVKDLETFPCRSEYHDILNRSVYEYEIENIYTLQFVHEETCRGSTWHVKILIDHANAYVDKLRQHLGKTLFSFNRLLNG